MQKRLKVYLLVLIIATFVEAKQEDVAQVDHLSLASMMVYDGKFDKAKVALEEAKKYDADLDLSKYYTIKGVIAMRQEKHNDAIGYLKQAVNATKSKVYLAPKEAKLQRKHLFSIGSDTKKKDLKVHKVTFDAEKIRKEQLVKLYRYLSQESYKVKAYLLTIKYLDLQGEEGRDQASEYMLRADCYWRSAHKDKAVEILTKGAKYFPKDQSLLKQKFYYFADLDCIKKRLFLLRHI